MLKSLQLFSWKTDCTAGMQSKTVRRQTVILRVPGFNAHMQCWSRRSQLKKESWFFCSFYVQNSPSLLCHRYRNVPWLISADYCTERLSYRRGKEAEEWSWISTGSNDALRLEGESDAEKSPCMSSHYPIYLLQCCVALKQSTRGQYKCCFLWNKHYLLCSCRLSVIKIVSLICCRLLRWCLTLEGTEGRKLVAFLQGKLSVNGKQQLLHVCVFLSQCHRRKRHQTSTRTRKLLKSLSECVCMCVWWVNEWPETALQLLCHVFIFNTHVPPPPPPSFFFTLFKHF